jgi:hypothetical protein
MTQQSLPVNYPKKGRAAKHSTPSFRVGHTGGVLTALDVHSLDPAAFRPTLDQLLKR